MSPCRVDRVTGLEKADGLVLLDPTLGAFHQMSSVDPAVDSAKPRDRKAGLDMFTAANGYDAANRRATYSPEFAAKFYAGQAARSAALIEQAKARLALVEQGKGNFKDDEPFVVPGMGPNAIGARLYQPDVRVVSKTRAAHPVLKADGSYRRRSPARSAAVRAHGRTKRSARSASCRRTPRCASSWRSRASASGKTSPSPKTTSSASTGSPR